MLAEVPDAWLEPVPGADRRTRCARRTSTSCRAARHPHGCRGGWRGARLAYQYVVLRCVPRPDREEFVNVGVVLYCQADGFLEVAWQVDPDRLRALDPLLDLAQVWTRSPSSRGSAPATRAAARPPGRSAPASASSRRRAAPSSSRGPVHGGVTADPARQLERLVATLVGG